MFQLIWQELALDELAEIYVAASVDERERMARAVDALNTRLQANPLTEGESRHGNVRLAFVALLSVLFEVAERERVVRVIRVLRYGH